MQLLTPEQVAEAFQIDVEKLHALRRRYGWPHVVLGRQIRFTPEQVAQIVAKHSEEDAAAFYEQAAIPGQTALSRTRSRR